MNVWQDPNCTSTCLVLSLTVNWQSLSTKSPEWLAHQLKWMIDQNEIHPRHVFVASFDILFHKNFFLNRVAVICYKNIGHNKFLSCLLRKCDTHLLLNFTWPFEKVSTKNYLHSIQVFICKWEEIITRIAARYQ